MRLLRRILLAVTVIVAMAAAFLGLHSVEREISTRLAEARRERARLNDENQRLLVERQALEGELVTLAVKQTNLALLGSNGVSIYVTNDRLRNPPTPGSSAEAERARGGP